MRSTPSSSGRSVSALLFVEDVLLQLLPVVIAPREHLLHERVQVVRCGCSLSAQDRLLGGAEQQQRKNDGNESHGKPVAPENT